MSLTNNESILNTVEGLKIPFIREPTQTHVPITTPKSTSEKEVLEKEVNLLLQKDAIESVDPSSVKYVSRLFTVLKKSGGLRPIINLRPLNKFIPKETYKMEGLQHLKLLLHRGDYLTKIDLTDAYLTIPIAEKSRNYLAFAFAHRMYRFKVLPFGLNIAPGRFTKIFKPIVAYLRSMSIRVIIWLDDLLVISSDIATCVKHTTLIVSLLQSLGFSVNKEKSLLQPTQIIEYLGVIINSKEMTLSLPNDKVKKIQSKEDYLIQTKSCSARTFAGFLGLCTFSRIAVMEAPLHFRSLQKDLISCQQIVSRPLDYNMVVHLSPSAVEDLYWWKNQLPLCNSNSIVPPPIDFRLYSDASDRAWGGCIDHLQVQGVWTLDQQNLHINARELLASFLTLESLLQTQENVHIQLQMDNKTAVSYVKKMGGTKSWTLCKIALDLWHWCRERRIFISAAYIPGKANTIADDLSRMKATTTELHLNPIIFRQIVAVYGQPEIDLFASERNRQVSVYISWIWDPKAAGTDAFSIDWGTFNLSYMFPPFSLVSKCLHKIQQEKASAILIAPFWKSQPWFPIMLEMLSDRPALLPMEKNVLLTQQFPVNKRRGAPLRLAAWPVS